MNNIDKAHHAKNLTRSQLIEARRTVKRAQQRVTELERELVQRAGALDDARRAA
jgi:hypothetical protein